jgi:hypothetical protein
VAGTLSLCPSYALPSFETRSFAALLRMRPEIGAALCKFATHTDLILRV